MLMLIGQMYAAPAIPKGIRRVKAAFGAIGCGTQRVQAKDRNALRGPDSFSFLIFRCERTPQDQVDKIHDDILVHNLYGSDQRLAGMELTHH